MSNRYKQGASQGDAAAAQRGERDMRQQRQRGAQRRQRGRSRAVLQREHLARRYVRARVPLQPRRRRQHGPSK